MTVLGGVGNVTIKSNNVVSSSTLNLINKFGEYSVKIDDPGNYTIKPESAKLSFAPVSKVVTVSASNQTGIDFTDTTTRLLTGKFWAGCKEIIGSAVLEFQDIKSRDENGAVRPVEFRKRTIATDPNSGFYSIRLPRRQYRVKVVSFSPSGSDQVDQADILAFFNTNFDSTAIKTALPYDSLLVDLRTKDTTKNLTYQRPPVLTVTGLDNEVCGAAYHIIPQLQKRKFEFQVWQKLPSVSMPLGCPVSKDTLKKDTVKLYTNINVDDVNGPVRKLILRNGVVKDSLVGGNPNILAPYFKTFNAQFTDRYQRQATQLNKPIVVTGVKADQASSFTTTTPGIPLLVLHDPPGDGSFSSWEQTKSTKLAMQVRIGGGLGVENWTEAKVGTDFEVFGVESKVWGTLNNNIEVSARMNNTNELLVSNSCTQSYSTASDDAVIGDGADVFVGGSFNLKYANSVEVAFNGCQLSNTKRILIDPNGFATTFIYTDDYIRKSTIPGLLASANTPGTSAADKKKYTDYANLWQQALANNEQNKARAEFDKNVSFAGSAGSITYSTTSSATASNTLEFDVEINSSLASEFGFDIGGTGSSGGSIVRMQVNVGGSVGGSVTKSTTMSYSLDDDDPMDNFTVNIKKDPVYSTPVFETLAGQSSCPLEANTLSLDQPSLVVPIQQISGLPANATAQYLFQVMNESVDATAQPRTFVLSFDENSNPFPAAIIKINNKPSATFDLPPNSSVNATVEVSRNPSGNLYSYEGLHFTLKDQCSGVVVKDAYISAGFQSACSDLVFNTPADNWICRSSDNNIIAVNFKGYDVTKLTSVALEYSPKNTGNWQNAFTKTAAQLSTGGNGTTENWSVAALADGDYDLRLKLNCASGTTYTQRATGVLDRKAPALLGKRQPTDDIYSAGDEISFSFDESIQTSGLNSNKVFLNRVSNGAVIPVTVNGYQNKMTVVPQTDLISFQNERFRIVVQNIPDLYGNLTNSDTSYFDVGTFVPQSGATAVTLSVSPVSILESSPGTMDFRFEVPSAVTNADSLQINFTIGGAALFGEDYTVSYSEPSKRNSFDGFNGSLVIPKNKSFAVLRIDPKTDAVNEGPESVILTLSQNPKYLFGGSFSATGTILQGTCVVNAGPDQTYDQSSGNKFLGNPSPAGGTWSGTGVTGNTFSTLQSSGTYPVRYCYTNIDGCSSCDTILVTIRPPVGKCDIPVITPGTGTYSSNQSVILSTKTTGAIIYYTLSGNNPVIGAGYTKVYTGPISLSNTVTLKAMAVKTSLTNSGVASAYFNFPLTANPVISPGTSVQPGNTLVTITCATAGATIYYTTNGNKPRFDVPNGFTRTYTGPFTITGAATIWAVAKHPDLQYSYTVSALISIPPVRFNPGTGTYPAGQLVTMTNTTAGALIYYTTDGTVPTVGNANTKLYTAPVAVNLSTTIRAISYKNSAQDGFTAVGYYTIPSVANPVFSPGPGVCASPCQISITSATAGARIWYTTGGFSPDSTKAYTKRYTGPISLLTAGTIQAQAYKKGFSNSGVVSGNYTVPAARVAVEGEEGEFTNDVQLFPNPTTGQFTVKGLPMEERLQIRIWNASGQEVRRLESAGQSDLDLNIGSETPGLYLIEIQTEASRKVLRLMKQ